MDPVKVEEPTRKEKAAATKQRIIKAATAEFTAGGYHGTPMASIAKRAGVAVQTVYFVFHTKPELFAAALDAAVLGPEGKDPMEQRWALDAVAGSRAPRETVESFIRGSAPILQRASALNAVARGAAPTDPELAEVYHSRERLRVNAYRDFVKQLALPARVNPARAADILITMLSPQFYQALRQERGWQHGEIVEWMATTIPGLMWGAT
ncbi:MAG: TetR/AcrR family transcriptional regulator [Nocardioidaceae bacterium]